MSVVVDVSDARDRRSRATSTSCRMRWRPIAARRGDRVHAIRAIATRDVRQARDRASAATPSRSGAASLYVNGKAVPSTLRRRARAATTTATSRRQVVRSARAAAIARRSTATPTTCSHDRRSPGREDRRPERCADFPRPERRCPAELRAARLRRARAERPSRRSADRRDQARRRGRRASRSCTTSCPPARCSCMGDNRDNSNDSRVLGRRADRRRDRPRDRHLDLATGATVSDWSRLGAIELERARPHDVVIVERVAPVAAPLPAELVERGDDRARAARSCRAGRRVRSANAAPSAGTMRSGLRHGFSTGLMSIARPSACCDSRSVPAIDAEVERRRVVGAPSSASSDGVVVVDEPHLADRKAELRRAGETARPRAPRSPRRRRARRARRRRRT